MKKYIVSVDLEIEAESAEGAFEEAMKHLDYDEVLRDATVAEPYVLDPEDDDDLDAFGRPPVKDWYATDGMPPTNH
jgi:hypothetical protein